MEVPEASPGESLLKDRSAQAQAVALADKMLDKTKPAEIPLMNEGPVGGRFMQLPYRAALSARVTSRRRHRIWKLRSWPLKIGPSSTLNAR